MGLWKAFRSNVAAADIGISSFFMAFVPIFVFVSNAAQLIEQPTGPIWLQICVAGLVGIGAARIISFNIEREDPTDETLRRWVYGISSGLWFGIWMMLMRVNESAASSVIQFVIGLVVFGGIAGFVGRTTTLEEAKNFGYDVSQPGKGFGGMRQALLMAFVYVMLAFNVSQLLSRERLVGPDHHSGPLLFCAVLALLLAWTPRAYRPLDLGRLGDVALTMRLALSFAVIGGVAAPFFLG